MTTNKITISFTIILVLLIISIPTIYKVVKKHNDNLYYSTESKIIEAAKKCYYEEVCQNNKILLKDLYKLDYLELINDPITKEYYNENSYVQINENEFSFVKVE